MNNPAKIIVGTLLGAGVGAGIAKVAGLSTQGDASDREPSQPRETFRERLDRARVVGEAAKAQREEELRQYFRTKVKNPQAMREHPTS
jgi:hypothetical protein